MYKKDGLPFVGNTGQVGMNAVFGGPRQMDINAMQDPYSGAMTRMSPTALGVADQVFGTQQQRQHVMNMQPGLAKLEKHALNKALVGDQDELPEYIKKEILAAPEDSEKSKDPLNYGSTPTFNRQYNSVEPTVHAQMDMAQIFQNYGNQIAQGSGNTTTSADSTTDFSTDTSLVGETPQSLRMQERTRNTAARIARRDARKKERGGGTKVGNFLRNTFN
jgi:hypothetical protein